MAAVSATMRGELANLLLAPCLVCLDDVAAIDAVWSCRQCFVTLHIGCIQAWAREGVQQHAYVSTQLFPDQVRVWECPKCRLEYGQDVYPSRYFCFCGRIEDPPHNPWLAPHSCGETCGKLLQPSCGHRCLLLCHPGRCPPCSKMLVDASCFCGSQKMARRCGAKFWSCGQPCGRVLACGTHRCSQPCHSGECAPCRQTSQQPCVCGAEQRLVTCLEPVWQCTRPCEKPLSCSHHRCDRGCHKPPCGPCPRSVNRSCPCGKRRTAALPCTEDVPPCGDSCLRTLGCGSHACQERCHVGPCSECRLLITKTCRCGSMTRSVPCSKDLVCNVKCNKIRSCGVHSCKRKCCDGHCPPCEELCGRTLACKTHKCPSSCHGESKCYPCPLSVTLSCACGVTTQTVPCGRERTTQLPRCRELCRRPPYCRHDHQTDHRCHFDERECPACNQLCNQPLSW